MTDHPTPAGGDEHVASVLIVDDADDVRLLVGHILGQAGMKVLETPSGTEALAMLAGGTIPDVLVLDLQMPDLDGWDTLAAIRGGLAPELAVVVCSVKAAPEDFRRGWLLGCDGYVAKPFEIEHLVAEVQRVAARTLEEREAIRAGRLAASEAELDADS